MKFNERIIEVLKTCKYTQKELAKALEISESNISGWKTGEHLPSVEVLYKLCVLLDESSDYLLGLTDETGSKIKPNKS